MAIVQSGPHSGDYVVDDLIQILSTDRQGFVLKHAVTGEIITLAGKRDMGITRIAYAALGASYGDAAPAVSRAQQMINDGEIS